MAYKLTRPCAHCPFRSDIPPFLRSARVSEIERGLERGEFACHATLDDDRWNENGDGEQDYYPNGTEEHCAGALILLEKLNRPK